jgi:RNA polymerase sigma-70 factor (ECF subfamily)
MTTEIHNRSMGQMDLSEASSSTLDPQATLAIRTNNQTSQRDFPPAVPAVGELEASEKIVERLLNRDSSALEELFDRMSGRAFGLAYRVLSDRPAAEDIVQDVFIWIWDNTHKLDARRKSIDGLLLTLTHRRAVDSLRRRSRRTALDATLLPSQFSEEVAELVDQVQRRSDAEEIRDCIDGLPPEQYEVVDLAYFVGMTHSEISEQTGLPLGTVKSRLRLAMNGLRKAFGLTNRLTGSGGAS